MASRDQALARMLREADALNVSRAAEAREECETPSGRCYGAPAWYRKGLALRFVCNQCAHDWEQEHKSANSVRYATCEGFINEKEDQCGNNGQRMGVAHTTVLCGYCLERYSDATELHAEGACNTCPLHPTPYAY